MIHRTQHFEHFIFWICRSTVQQALGEHPVIVRCRLHLSPGKEPSVHFPNGCHCLVRVGEHHEHSHGPHGPVGTSLLVHVELRKAEQAAGFMAGGVLCCLSPSRQFLRRWSSLTYDDVSCAVLTGIVARGITLPLRQEKGRGSTETHRQHTGESQWNCVLHQREGALGRAIIGNVLFG